MHDVEVEPDELRKSAEAAKDAAAEVRAVDLTAVTGLAAALPGSRAGEKSGELDAHWEQNATTWASNMDAYGEKLTASAESYEASDWAAEQVFGGLGDF